MLESPDSELRGYYATPIFLGKADDLIQLILPSENESQAQNARKIEDRPTSSQSDRGLHSLPYQRQNPRSIPRLCDQEGQI